MDVIYTGDNNVIINLTVNENGQVVDLTNATVEVLIRLKDMGKLKLAEIIDAPTGKCRITLFSDDLIYSGVYSLQATTTFADGSKFTSNIQRFTVEQKLGYIPSLNGGGSGGSTSVTTSPTNGNIKVNGIELKVYNDTTIKTDITNLKAKEHSHANSAALNRIGINETGKLTIDDVELPTGGANVEASTTNGNIKVNGTEVQVFDTSPLTTEITNLKNSDAVKRLGVSTNGILTIDGVEVTLDDPNSEIDGGTFTTTYTTEVIDGGEF